MKRLFHTGWFMLLVLALPFGLYATYQWYEKKYEPLPVLNGKDHRLHPFSLQDQDGRVVGPGNWEGRLQITGFFFSHCPIVCPKMIRSVKKVQQQVNPGKVQFIFITVDPKRDSVERLKTFAGVMELDTRNWSLLTGAKKEIYLLARNSYRLAVADGDGGPNDFIHSEMITLSDTDGRIRGYYDATSETDMQRLLADIKKIQP
jgi:protein SCO1